MTKEDWLEYQRRIRAYKKELRRRKQGDDNSPKVTAPTEEKVKSESNGTERC
jgi:hypothetical protein